MSPVAEMGIVEEQIEISEGVVELTVRAPEIAGLSRAGQFVHVRVSTGFDPFLRRPMSVGPCGDGRLKLIFAIRGRGTRLLAGKLPGNTVDMIGPLGRGFDHPEEGVIPLLVAGGIGVVPLLLLNEQLPVGLERDFLLGVRSRTVLTVTDSEIERRHISVATDDGSLGYRGDVVQLLARRLDELDGRKVNIYGCGPGPMLTFLKRLCQERSIPAQVSLEVPMGCGVGACQSCAVLKADRKGYLLVCQDGPVFDIDAVDLSPEALP